MRKKIEVAVVIVFLLLAIAVVGDMSYEDALKEQEIYCQHVKAGIWENYKQLDCK